MLSAYFKSDHVPDLALFEALTTVPFGMVSLEGDPNRLLNVWYDPDIGLDRACTALGLLFDVRWWPNDAPADDALACLRRWVAEGPVVIGPLNMDGLTYLFERQLYRMCDHYLVIWGVDLEGWWVSDSERSVSEVLREVVLIDAWRGDRIPEGRGAFVMRRLGQDQVPTLTPQALQRVLSWTQDNLLSAENTLRGGSKAYHAINCDLKLEWTSSFRCALSYAFPTRMQRVRHQMRLLHELLDQEVVSGLAAKHILLLMQEEAEQLALAIETVQTGGAPNMDRLCVLRSESSARWCALEVTDERRF